MVKKILKIIIFLVLIIAVVVIGFKVKNTFFSDEIIIEDSSSSGAASSIQTPQSSESSDSSTSTASSEKLTDISELETEYDSEEYFESLQNMFGTTKKIKVKPVSLTLQKSENLTEFTMNNSTESGVLVLIPDETAYRTAVESQSGLPYILGKYTYDFGKNSGNNTKNFSYNLSYSGENAVEITAVVTVSMIDSAADANQFVQTVCSQNVANAEEPNRFKFAEETLYGTITDSYGGSTIESAGTPLQNYRYLLSRSTNIAVQIDNDHVLAISVATNAQCSTTDYSDISDLLISIVRDEANQIEESVYNIYGLSAVLPAIRLAPAIEKSF